jgi:hypothetical protein
VICFIDLKCVSSGYIKESTHFVAPESASVFPFFSDLHETIVKTTSVKIEMVFFIIVYVNAN